VSLAFYVGGKGRGVRGNSRLEHRVPFPGSSRNFHIIQWRVPLFLTLPTSQDRACDWLLTPAYVKYAPYVKAAARTIWRAYRMYRSRRVKRARAPMQMSAYGTRKRPLKRRRKNMPKMGRKYVGEPIGSSTAKSNFSRWVDTSTFGTRTLNFHVINTTSQGTGINQRERTMINWRGTRICMFFRNTGNTNPVNLNIAVLAPKSTGAGNVR